MAIRGTTAHEAELIVRFEDGGSLKEIIKDIAGNVLSATFAPYSLKEKTMINNVKYPDKPVELKPGELSSGMMVRCVSSPRMDLIGQIFMVTTYMSASGRLLANLLNGEYVYATGLGLVRHSAPTTIEPRE